MSSTPTNPLRLPELLKRISRFVTLSDAVVCARVCKAWSDHFASAIWHTIDFAVHKDLHQMDTKVLVRYGHHIRVAKNIKDRDHIMALIVANANKLRQLSITMTATQEFYANFNDLLRRNNTSIKNLDILQASSGTAPFFMIDSFFPTPNSGMTSRLSSIKIQGLTMSRDSFSSLLMVCSALRHLNILFMMDNQSENVPSLFVHFPNLETWSTWSRLDVNVSMKAIRDEVTRCCASLKCLRTETTAPTAIGMLVQVFWNLTTICILNKELSSDMVMAVLNHQDTLNEIFTFIPHDGFYESETVPEVKSNKLDTSGWIIQSIPRRCLQLKTLRFSLYGMNMDDIEMADWGCHDLEVLHIRVHGLDTKEKIDQAIQLWKQGRVAIKKQVNDEQEGLICSNHQLDIVISPGDNSIEARVARHLLKFKKLRVVWLGWKIRKIA
ncbi:hypothetical protein BGX34_000778 [Mortierella sp. NVP85]|nr:hypothetical protein BGX34_000778 [Mortierella sp. NVP85]